VAAPKAPVLDGAGKKSSDVTLNERIFAAEAKPHLVHEAVRAEQNAARAGTRALKNRALVAGGRSKPWRQKGTGRARAGTTRAPHWTGGGAAFAVRTSFGGKVNRKERRAALRSALSLHAGRDSLSLVDAGAFEAPSTQQAAEGLEGWREPQPALVVVGPDEDNLQRSFRNLRQVRVLGVEAVGVADLVGAAWLVLSDAAAERLTDLAKREVRAREAV
jgi:large subunit ribosomal protein L4